MLIKKFKLLYFNNVKIIGIRGHLRGTGTSILFYSIVTLRKYKLNFKAILIAFKGVRGAYRVQEEQNFFKGIDCTT